MRLPLSVAVVFLGVASAPATDPLPGTQPLTETGDLAAKMVAGLHTYLDRELAAAAKGGAKADRERLQKMLGVVDQRVPPRLEYVSGPDEPPLVAETPHYKVYAVRWAVLAGVDGEGLLLEPTGEAAGAVVALPDADQTPEQIVGLAPGLPRDWQFARRLAENGARVLVPVLIDRRDTHSGNPVLKRQTNLPHREFVHRMAFEMGRTTVGYEVQKVLAAVDWFLARRPEQRVAVWGYGEGGRLALYAGALDDRIRATAVSGAIGARTKAWEEPLDRDLWGQLHGLGDAELLERIVTRPKPGVPMVEQGPTLKFAGPVVGKAGRSGAAPGRLDRPLDAQAEFRRLEDGLPGGGGRHTRVWQTGREDAVFADLFDPDRDPSSGERNRRRAERVTTPTELRKGFDPADRHRRQFDQLVAYTQRLWRDSDRVRREFWKGADASSPEAWEKSCDRLRAYFHEEVIGKLPEPTGPLNPRTRRVYDEPTFTGYEVMLDVFPDVFAQGILLLPKGLKPDEKRPVVVCQHGLEGTPRKCIDAEKGPTYFELARRLVEKGYVVYCPQNPYYGDTTFRQIQRKAHPLKLSLFSFIIRQHQRTLDWLETLPNVDKTKIGFYGLSYGGKTAMRVPAVEKRYCLSICSGDFNEWVGKCVSVDLDRSYMWTREYDMYEFDLGHTFNYAEMAYLIAPRPFMVERGHDDPVGTDDMVAGEYARVRYLYANRLKLPDRTAIDFQPGGHRIFLQDTLAFLERHLGKPGK